MAVTCVSVWQPPTPSPDPLSLYAATALPAIPVRVPPLVTAPCNRNGIRRVAWQVSTDMSAEGADMDKLSKEMDRLQNAIEAANGWELDRVLERAMDALRCPDGDALVGNLSGQVSQG